MSTTARNIVACALIVIVWAALVFGIAYQQNERKHRMTAEPVLVHTGIEKRAKIVTDTYQPLSTQYRELTRCYGGEPPKDGVKCDPVPLPKARPSAVTKSAPRAPRPMSMAVKIERCTVDAIRLCKDAIPNRAAIIACMNTKRDQLSPRCKTVFAAPKIDGNGNAAVPLKASKADPCALKGTSHRTATKHKSHRTPTSQLVNVDEYHDGASQWSRDHPGPIPNSGTSIPSSGHGGGHHSGGHAGGHSHSPPPHHTLC